MAQAMEFSRAGVDGEGHDALVGPVGAHRGTCPRDRPRFRPPNCRRENPPAEWIGFPRAARLPAIGMVVMKAVTVESSSLIT